MLSFKLCQLHFLEIPRIDLIDVSDSHNLVMNSISIVKELSNILEIQEQFVLEANGNTNLYEVFAFFELLTIYL